LPFAAGLVSNSAILRLLSPQFFSLRIKHIVNRAGRDGNRRQGYCGDPSDPVPLALIITALALSAFIMVWGASEFGIGGKVLKGAEWTYAQIAASHPTVTIPFVGATLVGAIGIQRMRKKHFRLNRKPSQQRSSASKHYNSPGHCLILFCFPLCCLTSIFRFDSEHETVEHQTFRIPG
jgi:hypothetical protein